MIPGSEVELGVLSRIPDVIEQWGAVLLANPARIVEIGDDKWLTFSFLQEHGIGTPVSSLIPLSEEFRTSVKFPLIIKPRRGHASENVFTVTNQHELEILQAYFEAKSIEPIVQELVGDRAIEFTASVLTGRNGELLGWIAMRRNLLGEFPRELKSNHSMRFASKQKGSPRHCKRGAPSIYSVVVLLRDAESSK